MKIEDVKNWPQRERRICRANLRLYPSQMKFIERNNLSMQAIFDKALDELGHKMPAPEEIKDLEYKYKPRGHGRGDVQRKRARNRR